MPGTDPLLTIVIPTLNRSETLFWTIRTVVEQGYGNLKIIISDNCSDDDTSEVVNRFLDERLEYRKTPQRFTMTQHFEYVLNYVNDGYISILGDDDGFLPNALEKVSFIIKKFKPVAIGWRFGNYNWPGLPCYFMIPMANYFRIIDSRKEIKRIFKESIYNTVRFPSLYGGFISMDLINDLKTKNNGIFFHSRIPDFFSGAFIAANTKQYIRLEFPITLNATSKHSTGYATVNTTADQRTFENLRSDEGNIPFHPSLKFIRCNVVPVAESLLQVNRLIPTFPKVSIEKVIDEIIIELAVESDCNKFLDIRNGLMEIGRLNNLELYVESALSKMSRYITPHKIKEKFSPISITLYVDSEKVGIANVYEAAAFAKEMISGKFFLLKYPVQKYICSVKQYFRYFILKYFSKKRNAL